MFISLAVLFICIASARAVSAQVGPAGEAGGMSLSAGGTFSGYTLGYGQRKMLGISAFVDADSKGSLGIEGEARWLTFHQTADVHASTYLAGPRYFRNVRRFQPYAKVLVGLGQFSFPYNFAHGNYLVVAPGGGVDFRINRRFRVRLADFEYQIWPQFTYGSMSSVGISAGIRYRIF
jgi:hypothetical protein